MSTPPPAAAPAPMTDEQLQHVRDHYCTGECGPALWFVRLVGHIDHLNAKLAAAQVYTPRAIERFDPDGDGKRQFGIMVPAAGGRYVLHSNHLDALSQVHTALNLTTYLLDETRRELAALKDANHYRDHL